MNGDLKKLVDDLVQQLGVNDPQTIALISRIAADLTVIGAQKAALLAQQAAGLDVVKQLDSIERELTHAQAGLQNLTARAQALTSMNVLAFLQGTLARVIAGALTA